MKMNTYKFFKDYGLVPFCCLGKIYPCIVTPNCSRNLFTNSTNNLIHVNTPRTSLLHKLRYWGTSFKYLLSLEFGSPRLQGKLVVRLELLLWINSQFLLPLPKTKADASWVERNTSVHTTVVHEDARSSKHELLARASVFSPTAHPITFTLNQLSNCGKGKAVLASHQMYLCGEPICHRVSCALLMVACKLALIISTAGRALFRRGKISDGSGRSLLGVWHKPLSCLIYHWCTSLPFWQQKSLHPVANWPHEPCLVRIFVENILTQMKKEKY